LQAGVIAAPGLLALHEGPRGLASDHARARALAAAIAAIPGIVIDPAAVHSNIVVFGLAPGSLTPAVLCARLRSRGVLANPFRAGVRFVTHRDVGAAGCEAAAAAVAAVLAEAGSGEADGCEGVSSAYGQGPRMAGVTTDSWWHSVVQGVNISMLGYL
jgi:threonine aldolase